MNEIKIGLIDENFSQSRSYLYYAQRGNSENYALGITPANALKNLENSERCLTEKYEEGLLDEVAFLALGAHAVVQESRAEEGLEIFGGHSGFIKKVTIHAPLLHRRWGELKNESFDGVWLYEVTERFGREFARALLAGNDKSPTEVLDSILNDL